MHVQPTPSQSQRRPQVGDSVGKKLTLGAKLGTELGLELGTEVGVEVGVEVGIELSVGAGVFLFLTGQPPLLSRNGFKLTLVEVSGQNSQRPQVIGQRYLLSPSQPSIPCFDATSKQKSEAAQDSGHSAKTVSPLLLSSL